jgi:PKHD-type hydroxylase
MLIPIKGLLSSEEAEKCRQALMRETWNDGRQTAGHVAINVKTNLQLSRDSQVAQQIGDLILDRLGAHPQFMSAVLPAKVLPPLFNRYESGGAYGNHVDNALLTLPNSSIKLRSDVSTTVFLSEPEEYEGGELVIQHSYGEERVKLAAGDAIVYPANSLHRVEPVTEGIRLAAFFWSQSLVASSEQRQMLYELDQSIQTLSMDHPESESIASLTHLYHNLLRHWSQT